MSFRNPLKRLVPRGGSRKKLMAAEIASYAAFQILRGGHKLSPHKLDSIGAGAMMTIGSSIAVSQSGRLEPPNRYRFTVRTFVVRTK
jgi:hypothetical protein